MSTNPQKEYMDKISIKCDEIKEKAGILKYEQEVYDMLTELQLIIYGYRNEIWREWVKNGIIEEMRSSR